MLGTFVVRYFRDSYEIDAKVSEAQRLLVMTKPWLEDLDGSFKSLEERIKDDERKWRWKRLKRKEEERQR